MSLNERIHQALLSRIRDFYENKLLDQKLRKLGKNRTNDDMVADYPYLSWRAPEFTTSPDDMVLLLDCMRELHYLGKVGMLVDGVVCTMMGMPEFGTLPFQQVADTAPEAVARAAAEALGVLSL